MSGRSARRPTWRAQRVLHPVALTSVGDYVGAGGGRGLDACSAQRPADVIAAVTASGLRGRGGAGFPAGVKWQTVAANAADAGAAAVVVNGAEGEPGAFKDRSIMRNDPYLVVEGAGIAALAVGADRVVIAVRRSCTAEVEALRRAIGEMTAAGLVPTGVTLSVFEGPDEYLFGEESALIETIDGRGPFPRVVPVYRSGLGGVPTLVNNVETIANVPRILERGVGWFRSVGTAASPGTVVCTVTGDTRRHGVAEVRAGLTLRQLIRVVGGGPRPGRPIKAVLNGVANPIIPGMHLGAAVSHEGMAAAGAGLGAGGFIVFDRSTDMVAVAAGVARFLSVESCGQCTPCKHDGGELAAVLTRIAANRSGPLDLVRVERLVGRVALGARCYLGVQQETVLTSLLECYRDEFDAHLAGRAPPAEPVPIAELVDLCDGVAQLDARHAEKQADWTYDTHDSGCSPIDLSPVRVRSTGAGPP